MAASASPQLEVMQRWEGILVSEYSQDRLRRRIAELEDEVIYLHKKIVAHQDMDKDRLLTEVAFFVVGVLVGLAGGFYANGSF